MFRFDPLNEDNYRVRDSDLNCYQRALKIIRDLGQGELYFLPEYQHFYVVVPGERWARNSYDSYPPLLCEKVINRGTLWEVTPESFSIFLD